MFFYSTSNYVDLVSDDKMVDSYITCSCCGVKMVDEGQLKMCISMAMDAEGFLSLTEAMSKAKHCNNQNN